MDNFKKILHFNICTLLLLSLIISVSCRPKDLHPAQAVLEIAEYDADFDGDLDQDALKKVKLCYQDDDLMELCQRCAKVTKSSIVFPMCCAGEDNSTKWCEEYVYYGIQ